MLEKKKNIKVNYKWELMIYFNVKRSSRKKEKKLSC